MLDFWYDWGYFLVNGGWSEWQIHPECSVTCGGGVKTRTRTCNNPTPADGGHQCLGLSTQSESCNMNPCPGNILFYKMHTPFLSVAQYIILFQLLVFWSWWRNNSECSVSCEWGVIQAAHIAFPPTLNDAGNEFIMIQNIAYILFLSKICVFFSLCI